MNSAIAVLLLACAVSGQYVTPYAGWNGNLWNNWNYGYNYWGGLPTTTGALPYTYTNALPYSYSAAPYTFSPYNYAPLATSSQYHSQDEIGQASFGYSHPGQAAVNYRDAFGNQVGSYAYINPDGKEIRVSYVADSQGFRVLSNDLPVAPTADLIAPIPVEDTPEVAEAKASHMAAIAAAKAGIIPALPVAPTVEAVELPKPVEDTIEVAAAKKEHAEAWRAAKAAADAAPDRKKRQVPIITSPFAYTIGAPLATPLTYAAPAMPVREATLTRTILNPGHAVAYRVD